LARAIAALLGPRPYRLAKRVRTALARAGAFDEPASEDAEPSREAGGRAVPIERRAAAGELVSVLIPTRSRPRELGHALSSALAQRGVEVEVIVIDDASPEPAKPVTERDNDAAVRVIRLPARAGAAAARNAGLAAARGRWVAFLDDDDGWEPGKLRAQLDAIHELGARWCWCATSMVYEHGTRRLVTVSEPQAIGDLLRLHNAVPGSASSVLAETALVRQLGGFDEAMPHLADWDLWIRLADAAPAAACQSVLVTQYVHQGGMHVTETAAAAAEVPPFRAKHPDVRPEALLEWVARAHWRSGRRFQALRYAAAARLPRRTTAKIQPGHHY
jgi:GT2 family glycosyltransferase